MVRINRKTVQQHNLRRGGGGGGVGGVLNMTRAKLLEKDSLIGALGLLGIGLLLVVYVLWTSPADGKLRAVSNENHPNLHLMDKNAEQYNAIALDILETLDCHKLLNTTTKANDNADLDESLTEGEGEDSNLAVKRRRRLEEEMPGAPDDDTEKAFVEGGGKGGGNAGGGGGADADEMADMEDEEGFGDDNFDNTDYEWKSPTAKHLFCLAAFASNDQRETGAWKDSIKCDATGKAQKSLLELWSMARGEIAPDLLLKVLEMAVESFRTIINKDFNLWAPRDDSGLEYMVAHVNDDQKTVDQGGLYGLEKNLGKGKVFVDVGSCLGTTSMAIALMYPGTKIVSIEVASPNWLYQELNFRCHEDKFQELPLILLAGVGPAHATTTFARYTWKPDQVTAARAWTPKHEIVDQDIELAVKLRPWHSILAEAEIEHDQTTNRAHIDVLNVDCGACEYNLIPSMTDDEFDSITTVMGGVHWGYIPKAKLPSSTRGKETHERLCKHENFARTAKECCQFPKMEVISSYPGEALVQEHDHNSAIGRAGTVADVSGDLCNDYRTWAVEKHVNDIDSDWGWFQLTPNARDD